MSETPKLRNATESVGWLNSQGPLDVSPAPVEGAETQIAEKLALVKQAQRDGELSVFEPRHHASWADIEWLLGRASSLQQQLAEARTENEALRERLGPVSPGGDDRIDELESAMGFLQDRAEQAEADRDLWRTRAITNEQGEQQAEAALAETRKTLDVSRELNRNQMETITEQADRLARLQAAQAEFVEAHNARKSEKKEFQGSMTMRTRMRYLKAVEGLLELSPPAPTDAPAEKGQDFDGQDKA